MRYQIQRLGIGQILDQSISVVKDNFGLLFTLYAITVMPFNFISAYLQSAASIGNPIGGELAGLYLIVVGLLGGIGGIVFNAAVIHGTATLFISRPTSVGECIKTGFSRFFPLLWTGILTGLAVGVGMILLIIPGILFAVWFSLAQEITVLEGINGSDAMGRSKKLMAGNFWKAVVLFIVLFAINFGIGLAAAMIPQPLVMAVLQTVAAGVTTILGSAMLVILYFSARCEHENFDLQMLTMAVAEEIESSR